MIPDFVAVPDAPAFLLRDARVPLDLATELPHLKAGPDRLAPCDILVEHGRVAALVPPDAVPPNGRPVVELRGGLVLPRFVDMHTHLDKGHILRRRQNPDGTSAGARSAVKADREAHWSASDVARRMDFALRCAFAHGTGAIRTHVDSLGRQTAISWPVVTAARDAWRDRIAIQAVSLFPYEIAVDDEPQFREIVETVARHGGVLGALTFTGSAPDAKLDLALDRILGAAAAHGLDLDCHVDESGSPDARSLGRIAAAAIRNRFPGRITAGHCCALALMPEDELARTIEQVGEAGIAIVSLPMCNMYLQDRVAGRTPRWRGVAPLHELAAAGIAVAVASDNTRDPFYAYGDLDMLEVFREATRIGQLDHSERPWIRCLGPDPADIVGLDGPGRIAVGGPADLVLVSARDLGELVTRPQADRVVLVRGRPIATAPPDYRDLD